MSSKKEIERREKITSTSQSPSPDLNITTEPTINTRTTIEVPLHEQRKEHHHAINRALDETKDNIRKSTEEARNEIPRYTQAVNEYQEQTIQASREIADNYIESQKQIINSLQSAWVPQIENANRMFTSNWISPRHLTEIYANMVRSFADNMIAATRLVNNMMFASMDAFKTSMRRSKDNAKELYRIGVNNARTFEQTSREGATRLGGDDTSTSTKVYVEREQEEQGQRRY